MDISHTLFELNCGYHSLILFKDDVNPHSKSHSVEELTKV